MPNPSISEALKEAFACATANVPIIETLELRHPGVSNPIYLVRWPTALQGKLETGETVLFKACGFNIALPSSGEDGAQEMMMTVDNVDRAVTKFLDTCEEVETPYPVTVKYRPYLLTNLTVGPEMSTPLTLYLSDVTIDNYTASGRATFADILNQRWPREFYNRDRFPGLGD